MSDFSEISGLIFNLEDQKVLDDFLMGLTTAAERQAMAQRLEIIKRLLQGQPQHEIAADLGVGVATVTRGSKELHAGRFKILREKYEKN